MKISIFLYVMSVQKKKVQVDKMTPIYKVRNMYINLLIKRLCYKIDRLSAWISNLNYDYNRKIIGYSTDEVQANNLYNKCKVSYTKIMVLKQKIDLPLNCRYIFVNYNNNLKPFKTTKEVLHFIEGNRLEIVDQQTFNESYVVLVKKADSFL